MARNYTSAERGNPAAPAILVIDDDTQIRSLFETILRHEGYDALLAEDGWRGIELFRRHADRIAVVILDWEMPRMKGDQVFDALCAIHRNVKVIVSSGHALSEIRRRFAGRPVADFLPKPFTPQELSAIVRAAWRGPDRGAACIPGPRPSGHTRHAGR